MTVPTPAEPCEPAEFRKTMGQFPTGVTLLTSGQLMEGHGMTVNSFTSVSLNPPMVLVCVTPNARINSCIDETGCFGISVLTDRHRRLAAYFADRRRLPGLNSPDGTRFSPGGQTGVPLVQDALAHLECTVAGHYEAGDHVIYLGDVRSAARLRTTAPMIFFKGTFTSVPAEPATASASSVSA